MSAVRPTRCGSSAVHKRSRKSIPAGKRERDERAAQVVVARGREAGAEADQRRDLPGIGSAHVSVSGGCKQLNHVSSRRLRRGENSRGALRRFRKGRMRPAKALGGQGKPAAHRQRRKGRAQGWRCSSRRADRDAKTAPVDNEMAKAARVGRCHSSHTPCRPVARRGRQRTRSWAMAPHRTLRGPILSVRGPDAHPSVPQTSVEAAIECGGHASRGRPRGARGQLAGQ